MGAKQAKGSGSKEAMLRLERLLWDLGRERVAGVDEVGLGPLAGPVVAAAVVFPSEPTTMLDVDDSKKLTARKRERLAAEIREHAAAVSLGTVEAEELDRIGVYRAGLEAMRRAVIGLDPAPDYLLVDAREVPDVAVGQTHYTGADGFIYSVSAASIVAKVHRDSVMAVLEERYPGYGFARNMGYGTAEHLAALARLGPCAIHRRSYAPVRKAMADGVAGSADARTSP